MTDIQMTKHDHILMGLFSSLQAATMQQLGKIHNPATGTMEVDLAGASSTIDIMDMLKVKCRTETPEELVRFMDNAVMEIQMNFLDEQKKQEAAAPEGNTETGAEA